ncbi:hypothetical protein P5V15_009546 [Pogonomyrmex californicus]
MFSSLSKIQKRAGSKIPKNWRLFHATDFYSLMYPCFILCRILGIFPYKMNDKTFKLSKLLFIISAIVVYVCCIRILITMYNMNISGELNMIDVPKFLERSFYYGLSSFIVVVTHILNGPRMHLLQTIAKISSRLPMEWYQKLSWFIHAKDIFGCFYVIITLILHYTDYYDIFFMFSAIYIDLLVFQVDMMYVNCVCVLKICFKKINDNLVILQKLIVNDAAKFLGLIDRKQRSLIMLIELKSLQEQYLMISNTVQMLNRIFSLQLVATLTMNFVVFTFAFYYYYYVVMQQEVMKIFILEKQYFYNCFVMVTVLFLAKTILIVWACESSKNQALEIGTTIHDVLNCTRNKHIKDELKLFSLQILHCDNTFSAKFFTVDASFFAAVSNQLFICFNYI